MPGKSDPSNDVFMISASVKTDFLNIKSNMKMDHPWMNSIPLHLREVCPFVADDDILRTRIKANKPCRRECWERRVCYVNQKDVSETLTKRGIAVISASRLRLTIWMSITIHYRNSYFGLPPQKKGNQPPQVQFIVVVGGQWAAPAKKVNGLNAEIWLVESGTTDANASRLFVMGDA